MLVSPIGATSLQVSQINRDLEESLGRRLRGAGHKAEAESLKLIRQDPNAQDLGSIVSVALGTPAVVELARAVADYLKRLAPAQRTIVIAHENSRVELSNPTADDLTKTFLDWSPS